MTFHAWRRCAVASAALSLLSVLSAAAQAPSLRPLNGVDELKAWFNANRAHPRVIFLLSPT